MNQEIEQKLYQMLADQFSLDAAEIRPEMTFEGDLGADSVDILDLSMSIEDEFGISEMEEEDITKIKTVADLVSYVQGKLG